MPTLHARLPSVEALVRALRSDPRFGSNIVTIETLAPVDARFGAWPAALDPAVRAAAEALGVTRLYSHQATAVASALHGEHVAVASGTASGKSLCYLLPLLHALAHDPKAHALALFPTKALAHDQLAALVRWSAELDAAVVRPAAYDGDTPTAARSAIRRSARVVVTNPDMLHTAILPHHTQWAELMGGLTHVVVDEMHVYRGVFGSHVANVLRRLRRVARYYGASPQFILTSATIANPGELGEALAGAPVHVVADDGAPKGARTFVFYNPPVVDETLNLRRSPVLEAEALARHFLAGGVQTIVFARSRQSAELIVRYLAETPGASRAGQATASPSATRGAAVPVVRGYRGGYLADERRAIEADLRDGRLNGVVATNALELGIDIGALDACIMTGYPGTIASTWQQAGRAGRRVGGSVAVLVAGTSPLDQFIVRHPAYFFGRSPEHARLDADNLLILLDHVRCAAFELPFEADEAARPFGAQPAALLAPDPAAESAAGAMTRSMPHDSGPPAVAQLLSVLEAQGVVRHVGSVWYWLAEGYPAQRVGLRTSGANEVTIVLRANTDAGDISSDVLGTVSRDLAAVTVHPGAIYLHDGAAYAVDALDWAGGQATVVPADGAVYTRASARVDVRPTRVVDEAPAAGVRTAHGELEIRTRATGYRKVRFRTHETVGWGDIDLPEQTSVVGGYWFSLDEGTVQALRDIGRWDYDPSGERGPDWAVQRTRALARDGHRCQMCNAEEAPGHPHHVHHIRPFRTFGWTPGHNEAWRAANDLDNLITVCASCHRTAERALGLHGGLSGVGYALGHVAPLYLMCDPRDLGVSTSVHAPWCRRPAVVVYERVAAGVGFGETLFHLHPQLLSSTAELIADCPCLRGCPSCVGAVDEAGPDAKGDALAVLGELGAAGA